MTKDPKVRLATVKQSKFKIKEGLRVREYIATFLTVVSDTCPLLTSLWSLKFNLKSFSLLTLLAVPTF